MGKKQNRIYNIDNWKEDYEYVISRQSRTSLPKYFQEKDMCKKLIRYCIFEKENMTIEDIAWNNLKWRVLQKYKIKCLGLKVFKDIRNLINHCFPEMPYKIEISDKVNIMYTSDIGKCMIIDKFIKERNLSIDDILKNQVIRQTDKEIQALIVGNFKSYEHLWNWYFQVKNINAEKLSSINSTRKYSLNSLKSRNKRIKIIKNYCENICKQDIRIVYNDNKKLINWTSQYFKSSIVSKKVFEYNDYYKSLYDCLIDAYPHIIENKVMFDWEWVQNNKYPREMQIRSLREFVLYRCNFSNLDTDIPRCMNRTFVSQRCPKLNKHIDRKRFKNYYQWCCLAFPKLAYKWNIRDFETCVAHDNTVCDSKQEMIVYESLKKKYSKLKYIGNLVDGEHTFYLKDGRRTCPDFVLEGYSDKPIYMEFYGMYEENHKNKRFIDYKDKTLKKNEFYKNNNNIYFVDIYRKDILNMKSVYSRIDKFIRGENGYER